MWSNKYYYLNICSDLKLTKSTNSDKLIEIINNTNEFSRIGQNEFQNLKNEPHIQMSLVYSESIDNWSSNDIELDRINLIAIVCAKTNLVEFNTILKKLTKIAKELNWKIFDEETDEGKENQIIWE